MLNANYVALLAGGGGAGLQRAVEPGPGDRKAPQRGQTPRPSSSHHPPLRIRQMYSIPRPEWKNVLPKILLITTNAHVSILTVSAYLQLVAWQQMIIAHIAHILTMNRFSLKYLQCVLPVYCIKKNVTLRRKYSNKSVAGYSTEYTSAGLKKTQVSLKYEY